MVILKKIIQLPLEEKAKLRCLVRQLNLIAGMTHSNIGFTVCQLSSAITYDKVSHLKANDILRHVKNTPGAIQFPRLKYLKDLKVVTYTVTSCAYLLDRG